jgi:hypothetical protein
VVAAKKAAKKKGRRSSQGQKKGASRRRTTKASKARERHALMVLGMHRSGTSALAGMLGLAGAELPARLMPATDANARGFFESQRLFELHEELLADLGTSWHDVSSPPSGFLRSPKAGLWVERLADAVEEEFGDAPLFVVKDPRICRFVPLWERVLDRVGVRPVYILAMRNPLDVAGSLRRQHQIEEGAGLLLWLDHVLRAERDSRGQPRVVIRYESLLDDWRRVLGRVEEQLGITFPRLSRGSEAEIDRFLSGSLRTQHPSAAGLEKREDLADWVKRVHTWAVESDRDGDLLPEALDPITDAVIEAERAFGPVLASSQLAFQELRLEATELRKALDDARDERNQRAEDLSKARNEYVVVCDETTRLREDLNEREGQLEVTRVAGNRRDEELSQARGELALSREETTRFREYVNEREGQLEVARQERSRQDDELTRVHGELASSRDETTRFREDLNEREGQLEVVRQERSRRGEELVKVQGELALSGEQMALLRANLKDRQEQSDQLFDWVKALLPWAAEIASGRPVSPDALGEMLAAFETAAPGERAAAATAGLRLGVQATRIEELEEDHGEHIKAEAELQRQLEESKKQLVDSADARAKELRMLDRRAAGLRAEFVVAVERAERRERELALQAGSHANEVAGLVEQAAASDAELSSLSASAARTAEERGMALADIADLELCLEHVRHQLLALEQSRTWRWSRPVRALVGGRR